MKIFTPLTHKFPTHKTEDTYLNYSGFVFIINKFLAKCITSINLQKDNTLWSLDLPLELWQDITEQHITYKWATRQDAVSDTEII